MTLDGRKRETPSSRKSEISLAAPAIQKGARIVLPGNKYLYKSLSGGKYHIIGKKIARHDYSA